MLSSDKNKFNRSLRNLFSLYSVEPEPAIYDLWFNVMQEYDLNDIYKGFLNYSKKDKFKPTPAGVISQMPCAMGISADEAWAYVPKSEFQGAYLTNKMSQALGQALPLIQAGDSIAARRAFICAYEGIGEDGSWFYSPGQGMSYEEQRENRVLSLNLIEDRQWQKRTTEKGLPLIASGLRKTRIESGIYSGGKLALTTQVGKLCKNLKEK